MSEQAPERLYFTPPYFKMMFVRIVPSAHDDLVYVRADVADGLQTDLDDARSGWESAVEYGRELERQRDELLAALHLILPMAKGYAGSNPVGSNKEYVARVENVLSYIIAKVEKQS